jgi:uncharacterized protein
VTSSGQRPVAKRVAHLPWPELHDALDRTGFALTAPQLTRAECRDLAALYRTGDFRSTIDMGRHRFGQGEYKYFDYPLPGIVSDLRAAFYAPLAEAANRWSKWLDDKVQYPPTLESFLKRCHREGQSRPTPLMLRYRSGDWNALHQDLYGDVAFPFQVVTLLDRPGTDFQGGEFVLLEQRPRAQSRAHVVSLRQGSFLIFTTRQRPAAGARGFYRIAMRHGVSTVSAGRRTTLGIIFHDAR